MNHSRSRWQVLSWARSVHLQWRAFSQRRALAGAGRQFFLFGVSRTDSLTYLFAATLLTSLVFAASCAPARRAMRVDPIVALRCE